MHEAHFLTGSHCLPNQLVLTFTLKSAMRVITGKYKDQYFQLGKNPQVEL